MKPLIMISGLALWLSACTTVNFKPNLPPLTSYSTQEQQQTAEGLEWMLTNQQPSGYDVIIRMIGDYGQLRAMIRAAQEDKIYNDK